MVIDPFRPGVMEKLGLGPEVFLDKNSGAAKGIIYARVAGFNASSKYKDMAGHDLNYIALSGALSLLTGETKPAFPLNLLADFAGGGALCVLGILTALISRTRTGRGQVVQVDMVSGSRYIATFPLLHASAQTSIWSMPRGQNILDGGAPFYSLYQCSRNPNEAANSLPQYMTVACLEPQFFKEFITIFKRNIPISPDSSLYNIPEEALQSERSNWPPLRRYLEEGFMRKTRDEWSAIYAGTDACAVPMLTPSEAALSSYDGNSVPSPHPFLSETPAPTPSQHSTPLRPGKHTQEILGEFGIGDEACRRLVKEEAIGGLGGLPAFKL